MWKNDNTRLLVRLLIWYWLLMIKNLYRSKHFQIAVNHTESIEIYSFSRADDDQHKIFPKFRWMIEPIWIISHVTNVFYSSGNDVCKIAYKKWPCIRADYVKENHRQFIWWLNNKWKKAIKRSDRSHGTVYHMQRAIVHFTFFL